MISIALSFKDTLNTREQVSGLLHDFFTDPFFHDDFPKKRNSGVRMVEEPGRYVIHFPVPGYNRHNLLLEIQEHEIVVKGKRRMPEKTLSDYLKELHTFTLPADANTDRIKAVCRNGLLEVSVKKYSAADKIKVIPMKGSPALQLKRNNFKWAALTENLTGLRNRFKRIFSFEKAGKFKMNKKSLIKSFRKQRLRLRRIPQELKAAISRMPLLMLVLLQALFVLLFTMITAGFYIMRFANADTGLM